jgi:hypothetical protein
VSTSDRRARDKDRDAAIEIVEAAWADGQIVEADRDKRVEELLRAQTLHEIEMYVHDLQPPAAPRPAPPGAAPPPLPPLAVVEYGPPASAPRVTPSPKPGRALLVLPLVVLVVVVIAAVGAVLALVRTSDPVGIGGPSGATYAPGVEPEGKDVNVLSVGGYDDLVTAVEEATGSSAAFSAVLYPAYAVLDLPVNGTSRRQGSWYWNGELSDNDSKGTSHYGRFDLRKVDPAVVVALVKKVRRLVEEPAAWYAIVRAPDEDGAMIYAYASNEYSESAYLAARRDGTITYDSTEH